MDKLDFYKKSKNSIIILFISIYFLNEVVRETFIEVNIVSKYNLIYVVSILYLIFTCFRYRVFNLINWNILFIFWILDILINTNFDIISKFRVFLFLIIPLYLCTCSFINLKLIKKMLKIYNILIILLLFIGIIDFLLGGKLQSGFCNIFSNYPLKELMYSERSWEVYRYYSIIGHPLNTATYFLVYIIMNYAYGIKNEFLINKNLIVIIGLLGILICGSKSAIVLGVLFIILTYTRKGKYKIINVLLIIIIIVALINTPMFRDILLKRFLVSINVGDITTGRSDIVNQLITSSYVQKPQFWGLGLGVSRLVAISLMNNVHNFEYPFLMFMYDFGIIGVIIIYIYMYLIPILKGFRYKKFDYIICLTTMFIMVNTNNAIANVGDAMVRYGFFMLVLNSVFFTKEIKNSL